MLGHMHTIMFSGLHLNSFVILSMVFSIILWYEPLHPECTFAITLFCGSYNKYKMQSAFVVANTIFSFDVITPSVFFSSSNVHTFSIISTLSVCI